MNFVKRIVRTLLDSSPAAMGVFLFTLAVLVRLALIIHFRTYEDLARYELERTAISLAQTGVYGNPYLLPTGPTAHVSPGYTLILAAIFNAFGTGTKAEIIKEVLATSVTALGIALLPAVAVALTLSKRAGLLAGLVMALYPARPLVEVEGDWETPYVMLALMLIAVLAAKLWRNRDLRWSTGVGHGISWGIALLFVSALLPLFAGFVLMDAFWLRAQLKKYMVFAAIEIVTVGTCLAPWILRNYFVLGAPIVTRSNNGLELRISNNDLAVADQRENYAHGLFERYHPLQSRAEALKVRRLGEVEYNRQAMSEAKRWIYNHPKRFVELTLGRIRCFWFYLDPTSRLKTIFLWVINIFGFTGLIAALRRRPVAGVSLGLIALVYPLPNYFVHVGLRQSYPTEWFMILLTASLAAGALERKAANAPQLTPV